MKQCRIGAQGPFVSCLGIGAMSFADFYGPTDETASHAILAAALEAGVTHIDTANVYGAGRSETAIGTFLMANPGARDRLHIATKASITRDADGNRAISNDPAHLEAELDKSLIRLKTDCVDLFYSHRRDPSWPIEEVAGAMGRLVDKGKCRAIGLSEVAPSTLRRAFSAYPVAAVQNEYSLSTRLPEMGLVQTCAELGVTLVAFSPVGRGLLTDTPPDAAKVATLPFMATNPRFMAPNLAFNLGIVARFRALAADMGVPTAALAIAWVVSRGDHVLPIPGTRSVAHFAELVKGTEITLSDEDLARIDAVLPIGWAFGDRYNDEQWIGPERYC